MWPNPALGVRYRGPVSLLGHTRLDKPMDSLDRYFRTLLTEDQVEGILARLVPLIASEEDAEFFKGALFIKLRSCNMPDAVRFIESLLKAA